jgi:hypothetical protein
LDEVGDFENSGRDVHLAQRHGATTGQFGTAYAACKVQVRRCHGANAERVSLEREDFATGKSQHLIPVPDSANGECCRSCGSIDSVLLDDRDADAPRSGHTLESHQLAGRHERNLVPTRDETVAGGKQRAIGDAIGDPTEPRDVGIDRRFRSVGRQAESS